MTDHAESALFEIDSLAELLEFLVRSLDQEWGDKPSIILMLLSQIRAEAQGGIKD